MKSLLNFVDQNIHLQEAQVPALGQAAIAAYNNSQLENTSRILVEAENNLRFAIGRYIHDNPQQHLQIAISLLREQAELWENDPQQATGQAREINRLVLELLNQADSELGLVRREVLPADPRAGTLVMSLETYIVEDFPRLHPNQTFEISYRLNGLDEVLDSPKNRQSEKMLISLFVREGLRNAYKYSRASLVEIESKIVYWVPQAGAGRNEHWNCSSAEGRYLRTAIKDNGCGFDPANLQESDDHSSFYDFEARVHLLGGFSRLVSTPGLGTLWEIYLPLHNTL